MTSSALYSGMTTLTVTATGIPSTRLALRFDRFERHCHLFADIPEISATALSQVRRQILEWFAHVVFDGDGSEVGLETVVVGRLEILEALLGHETHVGWVHERLPGRIIWSFHVHLRPRRADPVQFLHERDQVLHVLDRVDRIGPGHAAVTERQPALEIAHHIHARQRTAVYPRRARLLVSPAADVQDHA